MTKGNRKIVALAVLLVVFGLSFFRKGNFGNLLKNDRETVQTETETTENAAEPATADGNNPTQPNTPNYSGLEFPAIANGDIVVKYTGFSLKYNPEHEQADWVAYQFKKSELKAKVKRFDNFRADPNIPPNGSAAPEDYRGSGYDRGHLAPSADFKWSKQAQDDCFFMSNMSPQLHVFNAGIWEQLESKVRDWARANDEIYVVTGPVLKGGPFKKIGKNKKVSVPNYYYKVILDYREPSIKAIGFIMKHEGSTQPVSSFAVSVDEVERVTGIDFFTNLPDDVENKLEAELAPEKWF